MFRVVVNGLIVAQLSNYGLAYDKACRCKNLFYGNPDVTIEDRNGFLIEAIR